ncbi:Pyrroline-5-carboxylate reductase [Candidatus Roizmanbacteria bacterium]|nr:Pyrroline-5-carboxylate reductase [Candidatus Roizmanbacteria bacterium]
MEKDILGNKKIAVIGAGHIGQAIIKGLINSGKIKKSNIFISNKLNNIAIAKKSDYVFIAIKPFLVKEVLKEIKPVIKNKIILSVAAGVSLEMLLSYSNTNQKTVRLMPNIPVSENKGVIGFIANKNISNLEKNNTIKLISLLGKVFIVKKEEDLDVLTLVAGCGPAISAYFINLISRYAENQGFSQKESIGIALKIFEGTNNYLNSNNLTPSQLIESVATKGGVTEVIINSLNKVGMNNLFEGVMESGHDKLRQLKEKIKTE